MAESPLFQLQKATHAENLAKGRGARVAPPTSFVRYALEAYETNYRRAMALLLEYAPRAKVAKLAAAVARHDPARDEDGLPLPAHLFVPDVLRMTPGVGNSTAKVFEENPHMAEALLTVANALWDGCALLLDPEVGLPKEAAKGLPSRKRPRRAASADAEGKSLSRREYEERAWAIVSALPQPFTASEAREAYARAGLPERAYAHDWRLLKRWAEEGRLLMESPGLPNPAVFTVINP